MANGDWRMANGDCEWRLAIGDWPTSSQQSSMTPSIANESSIVNEIVNPQSKSPIANQQSVNRQSAISSRQ
jgi:hypothetical protein